MQASIRGCAGSVPSCISIASNCAPRGLIRSGKLLAGRVGIDSPQIDIERKGPHSFLLASQLELYPQLSDPSGFDLRALPGGRIHLKNAHVSLHGWNTALPELVLPAVNGDIQRTGDLLELDLKTQMPEALKGNLRVHAQARELGKWSSTTWELHAYARDFSLDEQRRIISPELLSEHPETGPSSRDRLLLQHEAFCKVLADAGVNLLSPVVQPGSPYQVFARDSSVTSLWPDGPPNPRQRAPGRRATSPKRRSRRE